MYLGVKLIVAEIQGRIDCLERLEINIHSFFFAIIGQDCTTVQNQAVFRNTGVEFQLLLS